MAVEDLRNCIVVVTGASSGIGRATALAFASRGASVVAAARNARALSELELAAADLSGEIVAQPTDVSDADAVAALGVAATTRFGRVDLWVNAAAVAMYARVEETEADELRRILDVNVVGTMNGMRTAHRIMRDGSGGTIVNIGSVESRRALPLQSAYAASKHAVRALTDAFRAELSHEASPIKLVLVMPSAINTPFFRHARSKLGVMPRPFPPVYQPEMVAESIVRMATHPVSELIVGGGGRGLVALDRFSTQLTDRVLGIRRLGRGEQESDRPDDGIDDLEGPLDEPGDIHGEWGHMARRRSWYTTLVGLHPVRTRLLTAGAAGIAVLATLRARR